MVGKGGCQKTMDEIIESIEQRNGFEDRLTRAFVSACIPFEKLNNPHLKELLESLNGGKKIPDPSTLRKNYVHKQSQMVIDIIRRKVGDSKVYFIIDETTDAKIRYCINVMVGVLNGQKHEPMLLNVEFSESSTDNIKIQEVVKNASKILWPGECDFHKLELIISDQAAYMIKAIEELKKKSISFPNIKHISCLCHAIHLVAGKIQNENSNLNKFMMNIKTFLLKSPKRRMDFKTRTGLTLPPVPVKTRWGTWLKTAEFYVKNYDVVKNFVLQYVPDSESQAFDILHHIVLNQDEIVQQQLLDIRKFFPIPPAITALETRNLTMNEQLSILEGVKTLIQGHKSLEFKLTESLRKNPDLISFTSSEKLSEKIEREYCPLVSVDVERSFSKYKHLLSPKRLSLSTENIKNLMLIQCNSFLF